MVRFQIRWCCRATAARDHHHHPAGACPRSPAPAAATESASRHEPKRDPKYTQQEETETVRGTSMIISPIVSRRFSGRFFTLFQRFSIEIAEVAPFFVHFNLKEMKVKNPTSLVIRQPVAVKDCPSAGGEIEQHITSILTGYKPERTDESKRPPKYEQKVKRKWTKYDQQVKTGCRNRSKK